MHKTYDGDTLGTTRDTRGFYSLCKLAGDTYHVQLFAVDVATSQPIKIGMEGKNG